jgi:hypothetical protein
MGLGRMIERLALEGSSPSSSVSPLRHSAGCAFAARGMDNPRPQRFLHHASITNTLRHTAMSREPVAMLSQPASWHVADRTPGLR